MPWKITLGVVVLLLIVASGVGYFIYSQASTNSQEANITLGAPGSVYFAPANVTVTLGRHVTLVIFNDDKSPHIFAIKAFNVSSGEIRPASTVRISFVANQLGRFPFYSPLNATEAQGQTNVNGTLTVKG
jgi:plastocyanin